VIFVLVSFPPAGYNDGELLSCAWRLNDGQSPCRPLRVATIYFGTCPLQQRVGRPPRRLAWQAARLEASWTDQEQKKFSENFEGTLKVFGKFLEDSRQHVSTINKKAAIIEEYLKTR